MMGLIPSASLDSTFSSSLLFPTGTGGACRDGIHLYAECKSRNPTRSHGNRGEGVAAQYRLSAPTGRPEKRREQLFVEP